MVTSSRLQVRGAAWLAQVSDEAVIEHVGRFAYERALGYVDAERVESINVGDNGRMLIGTVNGGGERPYTTMLTVPRVGAPASEWRSRCSCPVKESCKHVASMVLSGREALGATQGPPSGDKTWRDFADRFLGDEDAPQTFTDADALGLRIAPVLAPRSGTDSSPRTRFELIPCRRGKTGRWNMSIEWTDVRTDARSTGRRFFVPEQSQALAHLLERWRGAGGVMTRAPRLMLDELGGGVWDDLQLAVAAGVELLPAFAHPEANVELLPAPVRTDVRFADGPHGELIGRTEIDLHRPGRLVLIGDPAHGLVIVDEHDVVLAGLDRPMSSIAQWLSANGPVTVPESMAESFRQSQLPKLARRYGVVSGGSVDKPRLALVEPLRLHLKIARESDTAVRVTTCVRYPGGELHSMALDATPWTGRDRHNERVLVEQLEPLLRKASLLEAIGGIGWWPKDREIFADFAAVRFSHHLQELEQHDLIIVERADDLPVFEEAEDDPLIEIGAHDSDDIDWFDLQIEISVGGEKVPFEPLFRALARGEELLLLESGTWFSLDHPELQRLSMLIGEARELSDRRGDGLQLNKFHLGYWDELVELGVVTSASSAWLERVSRLESVGRGEPPVAPHGFTAALRPYQVDGFHWLASIWDARLGGILADDMGLGKTVQTLAMLSRAHEAGELTEPVLVVAPSSMVGTWVREAATFVPGMPVVAMQNTASKRGEPLQQSISGAAVVVTSYTVLRLDADEFWAQSWRGLILDEAQFIKNHQSKTFHAAKRLRTPFTLAITGTPLENSLMDLWAMLALAAPGLFPKPELFANTYRKPIESGAEPEKLEQLRRRIKPLMMRRTKEVVAADLPPKQVQLQEISLTSKHESYYKRHLQRERQRILGLLDDPEANRIAILSSLTRLRQLSLDPRLVDKDYTSREPSAKIAFLIDQLRELSAEGHRALVFSQFTSYLRLVETALTEAGISTTYLDGSTTNRQAVIDEFKDGDAAAFLISLKAGGVGLTLTEADYVFVLDPWWNPAAEAQAIDRAHRIGQDRPVMVYRLVSSGTIEQKVVDLQERKRDLFARVVDGGEGASGAITAADIREMLDV